MNELPKDLGGWQCLAEGALTRPGDIEVSDGEILDWVGAGGSDMTAMDYREWYGVSVYRKIPVAKQGDLDHVTLAPQLPKDPADRKKIPICTGVLDYFPDAIAAVAECSFAGNAQHHPGTALHWDKTKSTDESDALVRHLIQRGTRDTDGIRHSAKTAWRALALLQREIEAERVEE